MMTICKPGELRSRCEWQSPETAPRDRVILADAGYPWPVLAIWNEAIEEWATTMLECSQFEGKPDCGFVTEYEKELIAWMPAPDGAELRTGRRAALVCAGG